MLSQILPAVSARLIASGTRSARLYRGTILLLAAHISPMPALYPVPCAPRRNDCSWSAPRDELSRHGVMRSSMAQCCVSQSGYVLREMSSRASLIGDSSSWPIRGQGCFLHGSENTPSSNFCRDGVHLQAWVFGAARRHSLPRAIAVIALGWLRKARKSTASSLQDCLVFPLTASSSGMFLGS